VGDRDGHRYLVCSLCASEWYAPRARCTNCDTPKEVSRLGETPDSLVQGECCDDCGGYIKIMFQSKDPLMDPGADDLATLNLDLALASEGYQRTGRNLFFVTGHNEPSTGE
jgi:FdhE protein